MAYKRLIESEILKATMWKRGDRNQIHASSVQWDGFGSRQVYSFFSAVFGIIWWCEDTWSNEFLIRMCLGFNTTVTCHAVLKFRALLVAVMQSYLLQIHTKTRVHVSCQTHLWIFDCWSVFDSVFFILTQISNYQGKHFNFGPHNKHYSGYNRTEGKNLLNLQSVHRACVCPV